MGVQIEPMTDYMRGYAHGAMAASGKKNLSPVEREALDMQLERGVWQPKTPKPQPRK
jgi:hypothetical protein